MDYRVLQPISAYGSMGDGIESLDSEAAAEINEDGNLVLYPGSLVSVAVPESMRSGLYRMTVLIKMGSILPDGSDFVYAMFHPEGDASDLTSWGASLNYRYSDDAVLTGTPAAIVSSPTNPASNSYVQSPYLAAGASAYLDIWAEPAPGRFYVGSLAHAPNGIVAVANTTGAELVDTTFRTNQAAPNINGLLFWYDDTSSPVADSSFEICGILLHALPELFVPSFA